MGLNFFLQSQKVFTLRVMRHDLKGIYSREKKPNFKRISEQKGKKRENRKIHTSYSVKNYIE